MVIDTSVYVASLRSQEPGHSASLRFLDEASAAGEVVRAPALMISEVVAAVARGSGQPAIAHQVLRAMEHAQHVRLVPVTVALASRAAEIAADHGLRGCDSIFVALAEHLGEALVTLDQEQLRRGASVVATRQP